MLHDPSDARARQLVLERESTSLGIERYNKALERSDEADTGPGRRLVMSAVAATGQAIRDFVADADTGKPGRRHAAVRYLREMDADALGFLTATICVNALTGKKTALVAAARAVATAVAQDINYKLLRDSHAGLYRVVQKQLKKSTSPRHAVGVMNRTVALANEKSAAAGETEMPVFAFDVNEEIAVGSCLVELFIQATGLLEVVNERGRGATIQAVLRGTPKIMEWLSQAHDSAALFMPVWMPMLVKPRPWTTPTDGGYLTDIGGRADLVRSRNKAYKAELAQADMPEVYRALNAIQETPWAINTSVLDVMKVAWAAGGKLAGLPDRDLEELPGKPLGLERDPELFKADHPEEFKAWKRQRAEVYERNARGVSRRIAAAQKIALAEKFAAEPEIFFPHNLDFRGRCYPVPSILTPQGDDQAKALLHFAEGVPLGDDGAFWLAVHVANTFGVDKVSFEERVAWVNANNEMILDSALSPLDGQRAWADADSPWCALAACMEWAGFCLNGKDHVSRLPIALDGSCNGLQNFSAMLRDSVGGAATNLLPSPKPADIYTEVMKLAEKVIRRDAEAGNEYAIVLDGQLVRDIVKQPVMTLPYGVTISGMRDQVLGKLTERGVSSDFHVATYLASVLWKCIGEVVIAAREAMDWLKEASKVAASADLPVRWTTPAGFPVLQEYRVDSAKRVKVHMGAKLVYISCSIDGTKLDRRRQTLGISPNFVHSCDASHMMLTVNVAADEGITAFAMIHDSYGTHAGNAGIMAAALRQAFVDQYDSDVLGTFRTELAEQLPPEIAADLPPIPDFGDLDLNAVLDSRYFFA